VADLIEPQPKTLTGRLKLIVRALQLTLHDSKTQILNLYLNLAPFGGPIHGVQAASYAYFDQPASQLTRAQAALQLAVPASRYWHAGFDIIRPHGCATGHQQSYEDRGKPGNESNNSIHIN